MDAAEISIWQGIAQNVTHITLLVVLCLVYKMGFVGIAIASCAQYFARLISGMAFMRLTPKKRISDYVNEPFFAKVTF